MGVNFGYDATNHRILNANSVVTNTTTGASTAPLFQIINITNPATPLAFDLSGATAFFESNSLRFVYTSANPVPGCITLSESLHLGGADV